MAVEQGPHRDSLDGRLRVLALAAAIDGGGWGAAQLRGPPPGTLSICGMDLEIGLDDAVARLEGY